VQYFIVWNASLERAAAFINRLRVTVLENGEHVHIRAACFPDDALTFDDLIEATRKPRMLRGAGKLAPLAD